MIHLDDITSGYSTGKMNENFQKIEREFNEKTLRRDGLGNGEPNQMEVDLDMNSQDVINAGKISARTLEVNGTDLQSKIDEAERFAEEAREALELTREVSDKFGDVDSIVEEATLAKESAEGFAALSSEQAALAEQEADRAQGVVEQAVQDVVAGVDGAVAVAESAADRAETASDAAFVNADVKTSIEAGLTGPEAVELGEQFQVLSADGTGYRRYRKDSETVATEVGEGFPSPKAVLRPAWIGRREGWADTFFRNTAPGSAEEWLGRSRWGRAGTEDYWDVVDNPLFDGQAFRRTVVGSVGAQFSGIKIYLEDLGHMDGDSVTVRGLFVTGGGVIRMVTRPYDASGNPLSSSSYTALVADAGTVVASHVTVPPAGTDYLLVTPTRHSGEEMVWAAAWASIGETPMWPLQGDTAWAVAVAEYAESRPPAPDPEPEVKRPAFYGKEFLRSYLAKTAKIEGGSDTLKIAVLGSSSVNTPYRMVGPLRDILSDRYDVRAPGYISANTQLTAPPGGFRTGSGWTNVRVEPGLLGPDTAHAVSINTSATFNCGSLTEMSSAVIHYYRQPGGGSFSWRDGLSGTPTVVDTDGAAGHQYVEVLAVDRIYIDVTDQGTAGVILLGVDVRNDVAGAAVVHKFGAGGASIGRFLSVNSASMASFFNQLQPDLLIMQLGTNDLSSNTPPTEFASGMVAVAERVLSVAPLCDVMMILQGPASVGSEYTFEQYGDALYAACINKDFAFLNLNSFFGTYEEADARGMFEDLVHPGPDGGRAIGRVVSTMLIP